MIQATYAPDAAETRVPLRGRHLARIATQSRYLELKYQGME